MKKILIALAFLFASCLTYAQKTPGKTPSNAATTAKTATAGKTDKAKTTAGLKKDGTPDMRLKENKMKAKANATGPLKKDSTPDMRYKANKKK